VEYLDANTERLYYKALSLVRRGDTENLLIEFLQIPGMGLVKAGFLCQIFNGTVGCIDTHNIKLYDIPLNVLRYNYEAKAETQSAKVRQYVELCNGLGGSHALWSRWCDYVAKVRPFNWSSGAEVSHFHVAVITGVETGAITDLFSDLEYEATFRTEQKHE
jgi:hypothetical protein